MITYKQLPETYTDPVSKKLIALPGSFEGYDLTGVNLSGLNLTGMNFRNTLFRRTKVKGARFTGSSFVNSVFLNTSFHGNWLNGANFDGARIDKCTFNKVHLASALFTRTDISAQFTRCTMEGMRFEAGIIRHSSLIECDVMDSRYREMTYVDVLMRECILSKSNIEWASFFNTQMRECDIAGTYFEHVHFIRGSFSGIHWPSTSTKRIWFMNCIGQTSEDEQEQEQVHAVPRNQSSSAKPPSTCDTY